MLKFSFFTSLLLVALQACTTAPINVGDSIQLPVQSFVEDIGIHQHNSFPPVEFVAIDAGSGEGVPNLQLYIRSTRYFHNAPPFDKDIAWYCVFGAITDDKGRVSVRVPAHFFSTESQINLSERPWSENCFRIPAAPYDKTWRLSIKADVVPIDPAVAPENSIGL